MKNLRRENNLFGISSALTSGILWGLDTTLVGLIITMQPYSSFKEMVFLSPIIAAFLHDMSSAFWMTGYSVYKKDFFNIIKLMGTRSGRFVILAALFGGPVGMMGYLFAISNIGPGYTAAISSLYPAVGAFFSYVFLKEKLTKKGWFGLLLSITAVVILSYSPQNQESLNFTIGIIAALVCVLGWSLESVICAYGMKNDITPKQALTIRQMTSSIVYLFIVVVLFKGGNFAISAVMNHSMIFMFLTALIGTLSYIFYYTGIDSIGPVKATGLNITYSIWAIIFSMMILGGTFSMKLLFCSILIICGSVLVSKDQANNLN